ncbi:phosphatase PAP2 family protein [Paenalcaligenes sp. Me52]|uniref:phosphatase PAP2 family protein n=1 Tax=Paenalcaligenes sp. Me52 TaxID=3392038 RepID=UPI003D27828E
MEAFNQKLFLWINASADAPLWLIDSARFLAEWPLIIAALLALLTLPMHPKQAPLIILRVGCTLVLALTVAYLFRYNMEHARPFVMGLGRTLTEHAATSSFPSIHMTLVLATGFPLLLISVTRATGGMILFMSALVAWARIYLGVHFPFDMLGALVVSLLSALIVQRLPLEKLLPTRFSS